MQMQSEDHSREWGLSLNRMGPADPAQVVKLARAPLSTESSYGFPKSVSKNT